MEILTNWYVRRSRGRFWEGSDTAAFDTLYTVLETVCRVAAPLLPLLSERIWKDLTGGESVHLTDWPDAAAFPADPDLEADMDAVRIITSAVLAARKAERIRVRQPLAGATVVVEHADRLERFASVLTDELNLKSVSLVPLDESSAERFGVDKRLTVNARAAGPRLGKAVQGVIRAAKQGKWTEDAGSVVCGGVPLQAGEYELSLEAGELEGNEHQAIGVLPDGGFLLLDTDITPELAAEGVARDTIRAVQQARKDADLDVSDRISLKIWADAAASAALEANREVLCSETLATSLELNPAGVAAAAPVAVGDPAEPCTVQIQVGRA
jgi:isoleucyl-tRNA synthetase